MKILYICTHNRCRSILSEALTNALGEGVLTAASAGCQPVEEVHPMTLKYLSRQGINIKGLKSESWEKLAHFKPDLVATVCDSAANETCPVWMGKMPTVHWPLADPSKVTGSELEIENAFTSVIETIVQRVQALVKMTKTPGNSISVEEKIQSLILKSE